MKNIMSKQQLIQTQMIKKNGYSVLEIIISLALFGLIIMTATEIIFLLNKANNFLVEKKDLMDEVRIAQYFFVEQMRRAYAENDQKIEIKLDSDSSLVYIKFMSYDNEVLKDHKFIFDKQIDENETGILYFGSRANELTKKIRDIKLDYKQEKNLLGFKIIADGFDDLNFVLYMKNKTLEIK